jgi:uncharacterized protein (DUF1778 family)
MPARQSDASSASKVLINLRVTRRDRDLIDRAVEALGKSRTKFILEATRLAAENTLIDRTLFRLGPERIEPFQAALDAPAKPPEGLRYLLTRKTPWVG